ncbi:MAG TPA: flagellar hook-basal body complex protein FliE, partial [Pirellulales bacterium]|jgi:flagellar hook-basal body complex protein FliE|nr:flagellar hook-basal body complex protein FliE [Pirellulales bacterium]
VQPSVVLNSSSGGAAGPSGAQSSFKDFLLDSLRDVNAAQQQADKAVENLATGGDANPTEVLTAVQKADIAFRMMMQIRNKLVSAYQEVQAIRV